LWLPLFPHAGRGGERTAGRLGLLLQPVPARFRRDLAIYILLVVLLIWRPGGLIGVGSDLARK